LNGSNCELFYNNKKFTSEDLVNITKVSGATKEADTTKIGKFGLGFCSVYNLTEVPSFVTGDQTSYMKHTLVAEASSAFCIISFGTENPSV
jgi:HSP90 family molecular chaperone